MRKANALVLTAIALALSALSNSSHAQSSVTMYGIIDAGVTYVTNAGGSHQVKFDDGISYANRWGIKGTEDLGGGMKAVFDLESGFHLGNGTLANGGSLFGRAAYVGLQSDWGTLTFGNQIDMTQEMVYLFNVTAWASGYAINQGDFDRMNGDHLPNSVKFMSNTYGGFQFGGMYSFSNTPGDFHTGSAWSVGAQYQHGAFAMGAAYTQLNNPSGIYGFDPYAMIGVHTFFGRPTVSVDPTTGAVTDLYADSAFPVDKQGTFGIGASYVIGDVTLMSDFTYTQIKAFGESEHMLVAEGGADWQITPALALIGGYQYTHFDGHHWNQLSAGLHYALSKRTEVYLSGDWLKASQGVDAVIGYSFTPSSTTTQADVRIGMRHSF
ncbi:porin [Paraburkholderia tropica]|uniref:Outer membrane protein OmpU n=1 Tax=Paraburkholderia tropica TaxID=92647 RepID=A0A1A5XEC1_9BURK|nr:MULTISPECIES: porin [Paraburkholderia]MBB2978843.1 outer membrane protein OmpU [Paraburkholderia tropica]MBB2999326.1 outer membrane protein OmpU [Paraburkholderia tropica]MBB6318774.1 outer membrane protein OmpU [Paraburkholderia tropica]OBR51757.1 porin [Paraburkholderia tropica]QNB14335.1 porin [Paraburkholderia tropica]